MALENRISSLIALIDSNDTFCFDNKRQLELKICKDKCMKMGNELIDANVSIAVQMRNCFLLKQMSEIGKCESLYAVLALNKGFKSDSALLKHEIAYVLGQIRDDRAIPYLIDILSNTKEEAIVRHEAGEALAAIGDLSVIDVLKKFIKDPCKEVAQTCQLAVDGLEWTLKNKQKIELSNCHSVDPAPSYEKQGKKKKTVSELKEIYLNENLSLFKRYRAMFTLRDLGTNEACSALCEGFKSSSALFKHEIAFVLGQMMNSTAVPSLIKVLETESEHEMVRHEAAEALGSIATEDALPVIAKYVKDDQIVVKQSCEVAMDMHEYWNNDEIDNAINSNHQD